MDRAFASARVINYLLENGYTFIIRLQLNRDIFINGEKIPIKKYASEFKNHTPKNYLNAFKLKKSHYKVSSPIYYTYTKVKLNNVNSPLYLVAYTNTFEKPPVILITNKKVLHFKNAIQVCKCYLKRWMTEDYYKYLKNYLNIEKFKVTNLRKILFMFFLVFLSDLVVNMVNIICPKFYEIAKRKVSNPRKDPKFKSYIITDFVERLISYFITLLQANYLTHNFP